MELGKRHGHFNIEKQIITRTIGTLMTVYPRDQAAWVVLNDPAGCTTTEDVCTHQMGCYIY